MARAGRKQAQTRPDRGDGRTKRGTFAPGVSGNPRGIRVDSVVDDTGLQVHRRPATIQVRKQDEVGQGFASAFTGIGMPSRDKRLSHTYFPHTVSYTEAQDLWQTSDLASRVIEGPPNECFRQGHEITIADETGFDDLKELVEERAEELGIDDALQLAYSQERAYGGSAVLLLVNDGQTYDKPLDLDRVVEFRGVTVLEPVECYPYSFYADPLQPNYGKPELYQLNAIGMVGSKTVPASAGSQYIHESRLIVFPGIKVSRFQAASGTAGQHWGDSVLTRINSALRDFDIAFAGAGILASDFSQSIFHMEDFAKLVLAGEWDAIANRFAGIEMGRSNARAIVVDNSEKWERQTTNIAGLPDLLDRLASRFAAAADMPLTLLMGQSPKGLGNEGDSDIRFYYDRIASIQRRKLRRPLRRILELIMRTVGTRKVPLKWDVKFNPLWQLSEVERSTARLNQATTDEKYHMMNVVTEREIRNSRFRGDYSYETQLDDTEYEAHEETAAAQPDPDALVAMGRAPRSPAPKAGEPATKPPAEEPKE